MTTLTARFLCASFLFSFLVLSGCGGGSSSSGGGKTVTYSISQTTGPSCPGAKTSEGSDALGPHMSCTWYCATYKGQKRYVRLLFAKMGATGNKWAVISTSASECI